MEVFLLILRLGLTAVFGLAAIAKFYDPAGTEKALVGFGVPSSLARPLRSLLPAVEFIVAALLVFTSTSWYAAIGAAALLTVFTIAMLVQMVKGNAPDCHCFGQVHSEPIGVTSVVRNLVFLAVAAFLVMQGRASQGLSLNNSTQDTLLIVIGSGVLVLLTFALMHLQSISARQTDLLRRIDVMELLARDGGGVEREEAGSPHDGLSIGAMAPDFEAADLDEVRTTLDDLRSEGLPMLLVFVSPNCTPCKALVPEFEKWLDELSGKVAISFVSSGDPDDNRTKFGETVAARMVLQKGHEIGELFQTRWTPTAVFIDGNGRIASHANAGDTAIRDLVDSIRSEDVQKEFAHFTNGNGHSYSPLRIGQAVPDLAVVDVQGREIRTDYFRGKPTLVAFWSKTCPHCVNMVDELKTWERSRGKDEPNLIVFSDSEDESLDIDSPVVIDPGHETAVGFGMSGTPSAVLINENGRFMSETAVGAGGIWALIGKKI
ncbi:MAG TPA: MauE/DoxX family redox-associated membrane protein [Pyrinomonadaceae bacterium]|nr:MauE/DoxX family redox-associated membrane protein [Pyrinomonadaceae bacterium]